MNIRIVYEDDWLLVVDKPAGLLVIPSPKKEKRTLTSILNDDLKQRNISYRLHPCHRLDRETSGLLIYAKGKSLQQKMMEEFKQKRVAKTYIAAVQGILKPDRGEITKPIENSSAVTKYRVIHRAKDFTLAQVIPVTGRTNQIRIHFKGIGHPLVGERRFAFRKDFKLKANRLLLHAKGLEFVHPVTKQKIHLDIGLSLDLKKFLNARAGFSHTYKTIGHTGSSGLY